MPLFNNVEINHQDIADQVKLNWQIELGELLKASQNHTFAASLENQKFIVRVTPDPDLTRQANIDLELNFIAYLNRHELPVCAAVPSASNKLFIVHNQLIISVFKYATGEPIVYTDWLWMTQKPMVVGLGTWIAKLHKLSKCFSQEHPELVKHARQWNELHDGVLKSVVVPESDQISMQDPEQFGLIHGDVNPSNYHWDSSLSLPCMFDWDQVQLCWFLYDLSAPIFGVQMLEGAGSPIDMSPVPQANSKQYTDWLLEGYEAESHKSVDREQLTRMVKIRRALYKNFCSKAVLELDPESFMGKFCTFVDNWLSKDAI